MARNCSRFTTDPLQNHKGKMPDVDEFYDEKAGRPIRYSLRTTDRHGQSRNFTYMIKPQGSGWEFMVEGAQSKNRFQMTVARSSDGTYRIDTITHNDEPDFMGAGIPDALIPVAAQQLRGTIRSSTNKPESKEADNEWRSVPATKMWDRFVARSEATYDAERDIFTLK